MSKYNFDLAELKDKSWTVKQYYKRSQKVWSRRCELNRRFQWNEGQIAHMKELFKAVFDLETRMYSEVSSMKKDFDALAAGGNSRYRNYDITAVIRLKGGIKFPYADNDVLRFMDYDSEFDFGMSSVFARSNVEMRSIEDELHRDLNWNIEIFSYFLEKDMNDPYIPYLFHTVFEDGSIYSLEDMMYMHPDDFVICKEVNFYPDVEDS